MGTSRDLIEMVVDAAIRRHLPPELRTDVRDFNDKLQRVCDGIIAMDEKIDAMGKRLQIVERAVAALQDGQRPPPKGKPSPRSDDDTSPT